MSRIIITWFCLLIGFLMFGQEQQNLIRGKVINKETEALPFVNIIGLDKDGKEEITTLSDENGDFEISLLNISQLQFTYVGYQTQNTTLTNNEFVTIVLEEDNTVMDEVVITSKRPTIKREIDRLVFNVQDTPLATTNAWDIVSQTPGVTSLGDNLAIRGSQNILVTINDKRVMLTGEQLKEMLESTDGTLVDSVEVITNPPAKYDAEGAAVLNIKLKKNLSLGYKGSISNRFKQSTYAFNASGTQHTYSNDKINLSASYSFGKGTNARYNIDNVIYENGERWNTDLTRINKSLGRHNFQSELDVKIDSTLVLTIGGNGFVNEQTKGDFVIPTLIYNKENNVESNYTTFNKKRSNMVDYMGYFMLEKQFNKHKKLLWSSYFSYDNQDDNQEVLTQLNFKGKEPSEQFFATKNNALTRLAVSGVDYNVDKENTKWELGGKFSIVKALYTLDFFERQVNQPVFNKDKSNVFDYQEMNWAGYSSFTKKWDKWQLKTGLRGEYTGIKTSSSGVGNEKQSYFKLFPTLYIKHDINDDQDLVLSYGKRIERPSYSWMNPAKSYYSLFSYFKGDPDLKPAINHVFTLSYDYKEWSAELIYMKEIKPSMEISFQEEENKMLVYNYTNIDKRQQIGIELNTPYKIGDWLVLNSYLVVGYKEDYFYGIDNKLYKNDVFGMRGRLFASVNLDKKSNWKAMAIYNYSTRDIQGTFRISSYQRTDLIMSRDFIKNKLSANLYVYNIFGSDRQIISTNYANQNNYFKDYSDTQGFAISLKYNFGNNKVKHDLKDIDFEEKNRM